MSVQRGNEDPDPQDVFVNAKQPKLHQEYEPLFNPEGKGFALPKYVPPAHIPKLETDDIDQYQVKGIQADLGKSPMGGEVIHWIGLQGDKHVSLTSKWVHQNILENIRNKALRLGREYSMAIRDGKGKDFKVLPCKTFLTIPPSDTRTNDPPVEIIFSQNTCNYYYQGALDNCPCGSFANALAVMGYEMIADAFINLSPKWHQNGKFSMACISECGK